MEVEHLFEKLGKYTETDIYPYHMPGHKRRSFGILPEELYKIDITEIDGFDNLHQPEGILEKLQREASRIYGAEESFYLVNGSTCGILSAVSSALPAGGRILMARNCHRSAYHAAYLRGLDVRYLYPSYLGEYDIFDAVEAWQVREALEQESDVGAVLIVSPTYEGRIADVRAIADIVHSKGIPLIVDEAHGAHLGLGEELVPNSCQAGADLVIHSVHKTLPALTQTALLHVNGSLIDRGRLKRFLRIYQSSSPSYLLMASIDNALRYIDCRGREAFELFRQRYDAMARTLSRCRHLRFLPYEPGKQDVGKLLISVKGTELTGKQLYDILLREYRLQMEMASASFGLAMFTVNDGEEAYRRMTEALLDIDHRIGQNGQEGEKTFGAEEAVWDRKDWQADAFSLAEAWDMPTELVPLEESTGRRVGDFINLYPPGVPLLAPGEWIDEKTCKYIRNSVEQGLQVQGLQMQDGGNSCGGNILIPVIAEDTGRSDKMEK